jgi:carboxylate-amine ligase
LVDELLAFVQDDARFFDCELEVEHARTILARGTSAMRQRAVYAAARERGLEHDDALVQVVDWLAAESVAGLPVTP